MMRGWKYFVGCCCVYAYVHVRVRVYGPGREGAAPISIFTNRGPMHGFLLQEGVNGVWTYRDRVEGEGTHGGERGQDRNRDRDMRGQRGHYHRDRAKGKGKKDIGKKITAENTQTPVG